MTRYGILDVEESEFALSNLVAEGFTLGYASTKDESIILVSSSSGTMSFKTIVSLENEQFDKEEKTFLETLLEPLPGDATTKAIILALTVLVISVIFLYLVVSLRRSNRETEELILSATIETSEDDVEIMVDIEADDDPSMAINLDAEELVVKSVVEPKLEVVDEPEETLEQSLAAKAESGEGNSRLERRMKRKQQRELVEITEKMLANVPQTAQATLPPIDATLPPIDLAELPPPSDTELPPMPLPSMPIPQKEANCQECSAKFTIKDLRLTKVNCPICNAVVEL